MANNHLASCVVPSPPASLTFTGADSLMHDVLQELEQVRRTGRRMLILQRGARILAWMVCVTAVLILADYLLRFPSGVRLVFLLSAAGALAAGLWRYLVPAIAFRPGLTEVALRAERLIPALRGRLASSVEFVAAGTAEQSPLAARSVADARARLQGVRLSSLLAPRRTRRVLIAAGVVLLAVATLASLNPAMARIGVLRLAAPFSSAQWPARTGVESLMASATIHPRGQALALRARATKGDVERMRIVARQRTTTDGRPSEWSDLVLTHQGGGVYERLIDTDAESIEFSFHTSDAETEPESIDFITPPDLRQARLRADPPAYAAASTPPLDQDLGAGRDDRAVAPAGILAGSSITLSLTLNKPIEAQSRGEEWIRSTFAWSAPELPEFDSDPADPTLWRLSWTLRDSTELALHLVDEHGISNADPLRFRIQALQDHPASIVIVEPPADEHVLPTAAVPLTADARDDIGLTAVGFDVVRQREHEGASSLWSDTEQVTGVQVSLQRTLDLAAHELAPGDVLVVTALADDSFALDGASHPTARSAPRKLRIIGAAELSSQLRRDLAAIRQGAIRLDAQQGELQNDLRESGAQPDHPRGQARISERIAAHRQDLQAVLQRLERNRLTDDVLAEILRQADDLLAHAGQASSASAESIAQARTSPESEALQTALERQDDVRNELRDLIDLLDRDEDSWAVSRRIEDLLERMKELQAQTAAVSRRTVGRDAAELDAADRESIDKLTQRQREAAEDSRKLVDDLRKRSEASRAVDRNRSDTFREAADAADQARLSPTLDQAAQDVQQNKLQNAQAAQQSAAATLERMQRILQDTRRAQAQELQRRLASLVESLQRLVLVQEDEITALAESDDAALPERARAMIKLSRNTQDVAIEARAAGPQAQRIARSLDRAADAQGESITRLRATPPDRDRAAEAQERSLSLLKEALESARQLHQQAQQQEADRRRTEIADAYTKLRDRQEGVNAATIDLVAVAPDARDRRFLVESRRLGSLEQEIASELVALRTSSPEITNSLIVKHSTAEAESLAEEISRTLLAGDPGQSVTSRQQWLVDTLSRLVEALKPEPQAPDQPFATGENQEGGGEGGQGGEQQQQPQAIPPLAELILLRGLQEQIYLQTRETDAAADSPDRTDLLETLGRRQRELQSLGAQLLEALKNQGAPPAPPAPDSPEADEPAPGDIDPAEPLPEEAAPELSPLPLPIHRSQP